MATPSSPVDLDEVLKAELETIDRSRTARGLDLPSKKQRRDLVGLAFSGGGVRSATFNLGVLQSLHKHGVFKHVDYLSTVSGGGPSVC